MRRRFDEDEQEVLGYVRRWGWLFALAVIVLGVFGFVLRNCGRAAQDAADVAHEEYGAHGLLEKYRYFKRTAAAIEAKQADIEIMQRRVGDLQKTYGQDALKWPRDVRETYAQDRDSSVAFKLSFNKLASEYNAAMSDKFKAFVSGDLPQGWPENEKVPLKREFATYKIE